MTRLTSKTRLFPGLPYSQLRHCQPRQRIQIFLSTGAVGQEAFEASAGANFQSGYMIVGGNIVSPVPLNFNFLVSGSLNVTTVPDTSAVAGYRYDIDFNHLINAGSVSCETSDNGETTCLGTSGPVINFIQIPMTVDINNSYILDATLSVTAFASVGAVAVAEFAHTLDLTSVTVDNDFAGDITGLEVVFDSGLTMPVMRSSNVQIPEPTSLGVMLSGLIGLLGVLRGQDLVKQPPTQKT
jgi:hypothetical protein